MHRGASRDPQLEHWAGTERNGDLDELAGHEPGVAEEGEQARCLVFGELGDPGDVHRAADLE